MEEAGIGVYNKVQKTWNISDLPRHLKTIPWRPHWTSVNQCALGMLFWRNTSLRNAVYIIIYLNKYFFIGFRNASIKCYVNRESQYLSTFIDASIVKWWNYFCVKEGRLGKDESFLPRNYITSTQVSSPLQYFEYAFLVAEGVKMSQTVKYAAFGQDISLAKILKHKSRSMYSIAGVDTVEYSLHMNEEVKSWCPKSIWILSPIS